MGLAIPQHDADDPYEPHPLEGVLISDDERRYVDVDATAAALFGLAREELTGRRIDEFLDPARAAVVEERWQAFLTCEGGTGEYDVHRRDGTVRRLAFYARPNIAPGRHLCIVRDVTESRPAPGAAQANEARLGVAIDAASVCAWDWDIASDRIRSWGDVERVVHVRELPPSLERCLELVHPEDRPGVRAAFAEALAESVPIEAEFRLRGADGTTRWLLAKGHVMRDAAGAAVRVLGVAIDIDRHKRADEAQAERSLREHEARSAAEAAEARSAFLARAGALLAGSLDYREALRRIAVLAVPAVADWCIVDLARADGPLARLAVACADAGKAELAGELERDCPGDLRPAGGRPAILSADEPVADDAGAEPPLLRRLGFASCVRVPIAVRGTPWGLITLVSAESGRRYGPADLVLAEELGARVALAIDNAQLFAEAREANRIKDEFLAMVSHDLRGPLQSAIMWLHILHKEHLDEATQLRALAGIAESVRLQKRLIDDLADVSRIVAGKLAISVELLEPAALVESVLELLRSDAEAKGVRLEAALDRGCGSVAADPDRLQQIVWNLVSNAVKFTPAGGRVAVRVGRMERALEIIVSDTGEGIAPEFLPHVFDPFKQADLAGTSRTGLGLGLAIVRHLVERHGGTVGVESPGIGRGATFTVRLPLRGRTGPAPDGAASVAA
jgi:PAS domain S-box-containing protein